MINLLLLSNMGPSPKNSNSGLFVYNQFVALSKNEKLSVDFFYLNQDKKSGLAKLLRYPRFFVQFLMRYVFSKNKIDIIHVHFFFPLILFVYCYKLLRNNDVKVVVTFHGSDIYLYTPPNFIYRLSSYFVNEFIFVSEQLHAKFYRPVEKNILSAGILAVFKEQAEQDKEYDFIFVGHLDTNKGVDRLLKLVTQIEKTEKFNVAVVGSGPLQSAVEQGTCQSITYLGSKTPNELSVLYHKSKFLINLSYNESFGLVMCEAMACGTPVIATNTDGASAQITDKANGFLLDNSDSWLDKNGADYLTTCLALSEKEYKALACVAIETASKHKLSSISKRLYEIYSRLTTKV
jgi:glycosyltransferase involved in cell wall biosynthesis